MFQMCMGMDMAFILVPVAVDVQEVILPKQLLICQHLNGTAGSDYPLLWAEHIHRIRDFFHDMQIVGGGNNSFTGFICLNEQVYNAPGSLGVKPGSRLIQQNDLRLND